MFVACNMQILYIRHLYKLANIIFKGRRYFWLFFEELPVAGHVNLSIYNVAGQLVRILNDGSKVSGVYNAKWDGRDNQGYPAKSGIYFYQLIYARQRAVGKMLYLN
jgi:hypothetical protein